MNDLEIAQKYVIYEPDTGLFRWRFKHCRKAVAGGIAGHSGGGGYIALSITRQRWLAHRVAWLLTYGEWPKNLIDHINRDRTDNRIVNLRLATHAENHVNQDKQRNNGSGFRGVTRHPNGSFRMQLTKNRKRVASGYFSTAEDAYKAYCDASAKFNGEFFSGPTPQPTY